MTAPPSVAAGVLAVSLALVPSVRAQSPAPAANEILDNFNAKPGPAMPHHNEWHARHMYFNAGIIKWPSQLVTLATLAEGTVGDIKDVSLLGSSTPVKFEQTPAGLVIELPKQAPGDSAWTLKIAGAKP